MRDDNGLKFRNHIVEELDMSTAALMLRAQRFCRKQIVDELETEWCADGGIRDQMRDTFKQRR